MAAFTTYIYQPFFNILVGIYWALSRITPTPDMGIAVIIFAVVVRLIMLPLAITGDRSATEKRAISEKIKKIDQEYAHDPVRAKQAKKKLLKSNPAALISEFVMIIIQLIIILMLYRIFKTGLEGADFHLLYDFMPPIPRPINLNFLGKYDLSHPNVTLNIIQSLAIFSFEGLHMLTSPYSSSRHEFISVGLVLPIASYAIFALLPAGKKLFIITTLLFSIAVLLIKQVLYWYHIYLGSASRTEDNSN
jgi:membrane protein insertase Oxa1/YidC/SpoIIIJ